MSNPIEEDRPVSHFSLAWEAVASVLTEGPSAKVVNQSIRALRYHADTAKRWRFYGTSNECNRVADMLSMLPTSTPDQYPSIDEYTGGGTLINRYTTISNIQTECSDITCKQVIQFVLDGYEVLVHNDVICAVQKRN